MGQFTILWGAAAGPVVGPWTPVPVNPAYAGAISTIQARWVGDPTTGYVQLKGSVGGGATWIDTQQTAAILPVGLRPNVTPVLLVPSGLGNTPDSSSILMITTNGLMVISPAGVSAYYPTSPNRAYFDGASFPLN